MTSEILTYIFLVLLWSKPEVSRLCLAGSLILLIKFHWNITLYIYLRCVYSCFDAALAENSRCDIDGISHKPKIFIVWPLLSLLSSDLNWRSCKNYICLTVTNIVWQLTCKFGKYQSKHFVRINWFMEFIISNTVSLLIMFYTCFISIKLKHTHTHPNLKAVVLPFTFSRTLLDPVKLSLAKGPSDWFHY